MLEYESYIMILEYLFMLYRHKEPLYLLHLNRIVRLCELCLPPTSLQNSTFMRTMWAYFSSFRPKSACLDYFIPPADMLLQVDSISRFLPGILVLTCCFKDTQGSWTSVYSIFWFISSSPLPPVQVNMVEKRSLIQYIPIYSNSPKLNLLEN